MENIQLRCGESSKKLYLVDIDENWDAVNKRYLSENEMLAIRFHMEAYYSDNIQWE